MQTAKWKRLAHEFGTALSTLQGGNQQGNRGRQLVRVHALIRAGTHGRDGVGGVVRDAEVAPLISAPFFYYL